MDYLVEAAKQGHTEKVLAELRTGVNVNIVNGFDCTALLLAADSGHYEICQILLENGADVNKRSGEYRVSALHQASSRGHESVVRLLLENGATVNMKCKSDYTALHDASMEGHLEVVRRLLEHGADINATNSNMETALHCASRWGRRNVVMCLLQNGAIVKNLNIVQKSAAVIAKEQNHLEIVDILEKFPLYEAALNGDYYLCHRLLRSGTTQNRVDVFEANYVFNPAKAALNGGHWRLVNLFLQRKLNVNYKNIISEIPVLFWAMYNGHYEVVSYLLECGADPNTAVNGDTILHQATHKGRANLVRFLLLNGADPNKMDQRGFTPLHYAIMDGDEDIVADLLVHGADVNAVGANKETPLHLAFAGVHHNISQVLINKGADVEALNSSNQTPLDILNMKSAENQRIEEMMRPQIVPKNEVPACTWNSTKDSGQVDLDSARGYVSDSDATVEYPCLVKLSDSNGLKSKLDEFLALVLEIDDMVADAKLLQTGLQKESYIISTLQLDLENMNFRMKRDLKTKTTESEFEEMLKSLTEEQDKAKQKQSNLENEIKALRKNIAYLNAKKKLIYQDIGELL